MHIPGLHYPIPDYNILLPVGISFYTFQALSYTIDIYRDKLQPTRHLGRYMLFISFFPQLVAGPIERASNLLPQFKKKQVFDYVRVGHGCMMILWGLFKKVAIADNLGKYVDLVYKNPTDFSWLASIVASYGFAVQVYCDFSGYSDIAIGSAQILGINLMANFKRPFYARNFQELVRRWHVSLSLWLKDYVFISLGGSRKGIFRTNLNLMITMLVSGIWHGANWTFLLWGFFMGVFLILSRAMKPFRDRIMAVIDMPALPRRILQSFTTTSLFVFAIVFFRADRLC